MSGLSFPWPIYFLVTCPWVPKNPIFDFVHSIACLIFIQSLWYLQINRTGIKYLTSWKLGHIALFTFELHALDCWHVGSQVGDHCPLGYLFRQNRKNLVTRNIPLYGIKKMWGLITEVLMHIVIFGIFSMQQMQAEHSSSSQCKLGPPKLCVFQVTWNFKIGWVVRIFFFCCCSKFSYRDDRETIVWTVESPKILKKSLGGA